MSKRILPAALAGVALLLGSAGAFAQKPTKPQVAPAEPVPAEAPNEMVTKLTPELISDILSRTGLRSEISTDNVGDPLVIVDLASAGLPGQQMSVLFYACEQRACEDITLWTWFDTAQPVSLDTINAWNAETRWAKAYIDQDQDATLELDINATGGIGATALEVLIGTYGAQLQAFAERIGTGGAQPSK